MSFEQSLSIADAIQDELNQEVRAISLNGLRIAVKVTPVLDGRAKGNWFVSTGAPNRTINESRRQAQAIAEGNSVIASAASINYPTITLSNNLPYIEKLDRGSSTQAPSGITALVTQGLKNG